MGIIILSILFSHTLFCSAQSYVPEKDNAKTKVNPVIPIKAFAFNLADVKLLNSPFRHAMEMDSAYLLLLNPDRLLYRFYKNAGLPVKDSIYRGWESDGISGHTLGHYLSALSMMYVATSNIEFKKRVSYIINELERCQLARKTGYVGAVPKEDSIFGKVASGKIKSGGFDLNGGWSPWYVVHKIMAGLCDAYLYTGNKKSLKVVTAMADWTYNTINHLNDSTRLKMLNCEYGGMNEVLANIYSLTGEKKYLYLSYKFYDEFVMGKLANRIDPLPGKHSNTNVPKAIGSARQFELTGNNRDKTIASFFWESMTNHHSYVIGGNSNYEYCGNPDSLSERLSDATCETCNTYNMLKLTRHLFAWNPTATLMDYYERALYNHILASQNPVNGMMTYFVPLRMGTKKQFSDSFNTFTCCVGSGIENHSKYAEQIYNHDGKNTLWINLFIPSRLEWQQKGLQLTQQTEFPQREEVNFTIVLKKAADLIIKIRKPFWCKENPIIKISGKILNYSIDESGYISITKKWLNGEVLSVSLPMHLYTESMPDNANRIAFKYGPLVLAGQLGKEMPDPVYGTPVLITDNKNINNWIKPTGKPLQFEMKGVGKPFDVTLIPFYKIYDQYYSVYWDYFTNTAFTERQTAYEAQKKVQQEIEEKTIDNFRIGEMQPERDHNLFATEKSYTDEAFGRMGREARSDNYFMFDMKVQPGVINNLLLTLLGDDKDRKFDIFAEDTLLATEVWKGGITGKFYDKTYLIPNEIIKTKTVIKIKIAANYSKTAGRIFAVRILKG